MSSTIAMSQTRMSVTVVFELTIQHILHSWKISAQTSESEAKLASKCHMQEALVAAMYKHSCNKKQQLSYL